MLCSNCGNAVTEAESVEFEDARICAACKPLYIQKLREGVATVIFEGSHSMLRRMLTFLLHAAWCSAIQEAIFLGIMFKHDVQLDSMPALWLALIVSAVGVLLLLMIIRWRLRITLLDIPRRMFAPVLFLLGMTVIAGIIIIIVITVQIFETPHLTDVDLFRYYVLIIVFFAFSLTDIMIWFIFVLAVLWLLGKIRITRKLFGT